MTPADAVLVTGASTGIGKAIVEDLRDRNVRVFAAVRDLSTVEDHPLVTPLRLEVTSADEIAAAATLVSEELGEGKLRGIVNNAGIGVGGPLEFLPLDEIRKVLEVNVTAQIAVTQAFLPLLRSHGVSDPRIVMMGSISSRITPPFIGPYAASKHALLAMGESLRQELRPWGFHVSVIEPGNISTPIWSKGVDTTAELKDTLPPRAHELYGDVIDGFGGLMQDSDRRGIPPRRVAEKVHHALFAKRPRAEYLVGNDARQMAFGRAVIPARVLDRIVEREYKRRGKARG